MLREPREKISTTQSVFYGVDTDANIVTEYTKATCKVYFDGDGTTSHVLGIDTDVIRGEHSAFDDQFQSAVEKVTQLHERISDLEDGPAEFTLVKNCASICKVMHLLRAVGPYISHDKFQAFDDSVIGSLGRIIGEPIKDHARIQATLPTSQSGLGLMSAATMGQVAFIAARTESGAFVGHLCDGIDSIFHIGDRLHTRFNAEVTGVINDFSLKLRPESRTVASDAIDLAAKDSTDRFEAFINGKVPSRNRVREEQDALLQPAGVEDFESIARDRLQGVLSQTIGSDENGR